MRKDSLHEIPVLDIYLHEENPRHDPLDSQDEIIEKLLKDEKVRNLARDIASHGETSPLEIPGVIKDENGHYIVVEGNRRICALTLLNNPAKSPSGERRYFENLIKSAPSIPDKILCHVFESHETAKPWIEKRHNGEQDGVGTKAWDATQKARAQENPRDAISYTLIQYAVNNGIWKQDDDRSKRILTTASRYFSNPNFRSAFGIISGPREKDVEINVETEGFNKALGQFFNDIVTPNSGVDSRQNVDSIEQYASKLLKGDNTLVRSSSTLKVAECTNQNKNTTKNNGTTNGNSSSSSKRNNNSPDTRKKVIPSSVKISISNTILKRIFDEVRGIDSSKYTLASVTVLRCFLENVYSYYTEKVMGQTPPLKTHMKIKKVVSYLEKNKNSLEKSQRNALQTLKKAGSQEDHFLSGDTLGFYVHGGAYPDRVQINRQWDNIEAIILYMLAEIENAA